MFWLVSPTMMEVCQSMHYQVQPFNSAFIYHLKPGSDQRRNHNRKHHTQTPYHIYHLGVKEGQVLLMSSTLLSLRMLLMIMILTLV